MSGGSGEPLSEERLEAVANALLNPPPPGLSYRGHRMDVLRALAREILLPVETARDDWKRTAEMCAEECGEHMQRADRAEEELARMKAWEREQERGR